MIGPLGFAGKNLSRRGFHSLLAFLGLTVTITGTTFLLLLGQGLYLRLGATLSMKGTFGIDWLFFGYLQLALILVIILGIVSTSYLVSSMTNQRMKDIGVIKAAGSLPRRLFSYAFAESLLVITSSCLIGAIASLLLYVAWAWPSVELFAQVGGFPDAGAVILLIVPLASLLLSIAAARYQIGKMININTIGAVSTQLSGLDLNKLGKPLHIKRLGSAFNLATRNVARDREINKTTVRVIIGIFLTVVVLTGALISADTSKSYVERALPTNVLLVANNSLYNQYVKIGTAFSNTSPIASFNYFNQTYMIGPTLVASLRGISGVQAVDTRLITMTTVSGSIKAHLQTNETSGNYNNVYVPAVYLGTARALVVGIDPNSVVGNWHTSDGFLQANDLSNTMVAGDSLVGDIVQTPFSLAQINALGSAFNVRGGLVDPVNAGRILYAPLKSLQNITGIMGYNLLLVKTNGDPAAISAVEQLASSNNLVAGPMDILLRTNLDFLNTTWGYFFILPILTLILAAGILLGYVTTNFSKRFNDYLLLRILGARSLYSLKLFLWESWGLLAVCMIIAIPLAWLFSIFFLLPEATISTTDLEFGSTVCILILTLVSVVSAVIYSRRLRLMTVKDLRV